MPNKLVNQCNLHLQGSEITIMTGSIRIKNQRLSNIFGCLSRASM